MGTSSPGFFGRIAATVMARPRLWAVVLLTVTALAGGLGSLLQINPNILELLPKDHPTTQAIRTLNEEEGGANLLTISLRGDDPEDLDAFMSELSDRLEAMPTVDYALYDLDPDMAWRIGLLQLTPEELGTIRTRLSGAVAMGPAATNPFVASRLLDLGPLTQKLASADQANVLGPREGIARVLVRPTGSAYDATFAQPFMASVHGLLDELDPEARGLEIVWIGGAYRHAVEDVENIRADFQWTALLSLGLVLTLIATAFRDIRAIFLIFVPLVAGNVWTSGYAGVSVGVLNTFTSFFPAILIGLGVDFSIHLYSRYREERAAGGELKDAVIRAWDKAGPATATAGLTSAGGFCALWAAGFKGFQQLGTILAGGVLLCLAAVLFILPLLILWREKAPRAVPLRRFRVRRRRRPPTYRLAPLGLLIAVLITVAAGLLIPRLEFEYDISKLRTEGLAYEDLDEEQRALAQGSYAPIVVSFDDAETLAAEHARLSAALKQGELENVGGLLSLHTVIPIDQEERVGQLQEIAALARDPNVQYLPPQVQQNLARIAAAEPAPLSAEDLPASLRHVLGAAGGHHRMLLLPTGNMWDLRENVKLYRTVQEWLPEARAAGEYLAMAVLYDLVKHDGPRVAGAALLVVLLFTWLDMRSLPRSLGAVAALLVGLSWAGAGLVLFDIKFSLVNFVGVPILMGIGVDVVIHLLHRLFEEGPGRVRVALSTTGWASGLSAATTVLSFAALSVASAEGVRSLGMLITLGLTLVTVATLIVVPLGWMTTWKVKGDLPETWPPPEDDDEDVGDDDTVEDE